MPYAATESELVDLFGRYGVVTRATIVTDRETGRSRGYGFVEMEEPDEGRAAIEALAGGDFMGRPLTVNEARPRGSGTGKRVIGDGSGGTRREDGEQDTPQHDRDASTPEPVASESGSSSGYTNRLRRRPSGYSHAARA